MNKEKNNLSLSCLILAKKLRIKIKEAINTVVMHKKSHAVLCPIATLKFKMEALKHNPKKIFSVKFAKRVVMALTVIFVVEMSLFVPPTEANDAMKNLHNKAKEVIVDILDLSQLNSLPKNELKEYEVKYTLDRTLTAYNSEVGQCDATPCITANGFDVCEHGIEDTVAANFLPFGTMIRIPDLFGDRIFIVRDRMNVKHPNRVDVWFKDKGEAKKFGVKYATIQILEKVEDEESGELAKK